MYYLMKPTYLDDYLVPIIVDTGDSGLVEGSRDET